MFMPIHCKRHRLSFLVSYFSEAVKKKGSACRNIGINNRVFHLAFSLSLELIRHSSTYYGSTFMCIVHLRLLLVSSVQWNLDLTNLYIAKSSI